MSYVDSNLLPNENVIDRAEIHWFIYVRGTIIILLSIPLFVWTFGYTWSFFFNLGLAIFVIGSLDFLLSHIYKISTELALTNRRTIVKVGLIRRYTSELLHGKVESVTVDQGVIGRIFDFGTVVLRGAGSGTAIRSINNPIEFRKKALELLERESA